MYDARKLNQYNRPKLIKIIMEIEAEKEILNNAINEITIDLEELKIEKNQEMEQYDWELQQEKERNHIS